MYSCKQPGTRRRRRQESRPRQACQNRSQTQERVRKSVDLEQLDLELEGRIRGNHRWEAPRAICLRNSGDTEDQYAGSSMHGEEKVGNAEQTGEAREAPNVGHI